MKTKILMISLSILFFSCEKLEPIEDGDTVKIETGTYDWVTGNITSNLVTNGDGIVQIGHVWSTSNNTPTIDDSQIVTSSNLSEGSYTDQLNLVDPNETYFIRAYAKDIYDCDHYDTIGIVLGAAVNASFTIDLNTPLCTGVPCSVEFTNTSTNGVKYTWDFDDGTSADKVNTDPFTHTFNESGIFNVTMEAEGTGGQMAEFSMEIEVRAVTFQKILPNYSEGKAVELGPNGEYYVGGIKSGSNANMLLLKIQNGTPDPTITPFEFDFSQTDNLGDIFYDESGGSFIIAGSEYDSNNNEFNSTIFRVDPSTGEVIGNRNTSNSNSTNKEFYKLTQSNNKLVAVGYSKEVGNPNRKMLVTNFEIGQTLGQNCSKSISFNLNQSMEAFDAVSTLNGYVLVGYQTGTSLTASFVIIDNSCSASSDVNFGGSGSTAYGIEKISDNEFLICGVIFNSTFTNEEVLLIKLDVSGNIIDDLSSKFSGNQQRAIATKIASDGSIFLVGKKNNQGWLTKRDANGNLKWEKFFNEGILNSLEITPDGGVIATGSSGGAMLIVRTDKDGNIF